MRLKIILLLSALSGAILAWNLHTMFLKVPDELNQGAIFRIIYFRRVCSEHASPTTRSDMVA